MDDKKKDTRVLVITSLIPINEIERKKDENDILLVTEENLSKRYSISFNYFFIFPRSFYILGVFSKKWKSYYNLQKKERINIKGRDITLISQFLFRRKFFFRSFYYKLSLFLHKQKIDKVMNEFRPTVIHAHNIDNQAAIARWLGRKYNVPYIVTLRSTEVIDGLVRRNITEAKEVISLTENLINDRIRKLGRKIRIIPHALAENSFYDLNAVIKRKINNPIKLISIARLLKYKNIDFVIKQLNEVKNRIDFQYTIYGDGPEYEYIYNLIKKMKLSDRVFLKGKIPHNEVRQRLFNSDLFILLSYPETFGRVFIESLATGTPFIARKNTGIYGLIENNKESVFCHKEDFQLVLLTLLDDRNKIERMAINARKASERFTWGKVSSTIMEIYKKTAE